MVHKLMVMMPKPILMISRRQSRS